MENLCPNIARIRLGNARAYLSKFSKTVRISAFPALSFSCLKNACVTLEGWKTYIKYSAEIMISNPDFAFKKYFYDQKTTVNQEHPI